MSVRAVAVAYVLSGRHFLTYGASVKEGGLFCFRFFSLSFDDETGDSLSSHHATFLTNTEHNDKSCWSYEPEEIIGEEHK